MASLAEWSQATLPAPEGLSIHCDAFMGRRRDGSPLAFDHPLFSAAIFRLLGGPFQALPEDRLRPHNDLARQK
jgi:hypothetical protein